VDIVTEGKPSLHGNAHSLQTTTAAVHLQHCSKRAAPASQGLDPEEEMVAYTYL
jgi:hypothetical protein